jgi:signal transduction histidine kinase
VEQKTIQLLTRKDEPKWWAPLRAADTLGCKWQLSAEFNPAAGVILIPRAELTEIRKEELSHSKAFILVDDSWTMQNLKRALALVRGALFLDSSQTPADAFKVVQVALARQAERERNNQIMQMMRSQNRQIQALNVSLEETVRERTNFDAESRRASQKNISRVREIISFIKDMAQVLEISDLLPLIRRQVKEYHSLESPLLFIPRGEGFGDLYYMRLSQTIRTRVRGEWETSPRIRLNEAKDSQFLANAMGRPVAKVLRFPLITVRHQKEPSRSPLLLFEHNMPPEDLEPLMASLTETLQPVSWALDRLVLEQELKSSSRDWETTFDELPEPIAILDHEGRVLRSNSHWRAEFKDVLTQASSRLRLGAQLYAVEKYPIRMQPDQPPISWVIYLRDETRSQKLKSQVLQVEKMSAIGQLAGHIAHELNNPLTGIRSLSQVLLSEIPASSQTFTDLQEVEKASARCQNIINNLLEFSRGGIDHKVQIMDLNEIAKKTLPFLKSATGKFRSDIQLSDGELPVKVEPHLMQQVIFNLVNNACQAMKEKGEISVHTRQQSEWAVLEVKDTGPGIAPDLKERIFEPFFTTKADGEGTGLGLSLSRDFVRQFGGDLELESERGEGSTFRVRLPLETLK